MLSIEKTMDTRGAIDSIYSYMCDFTENPHVTRNKANSEQLSKHLELVNFLLDREAFSDHDIYHFLLELYGENALDW